MVESMSRFNVKLAVRPAGSIGLFSAVFPHAVESHSAAEALDQAIVAATVAGYECGGWSRVDLDPVSLPDELARMVVFAAAHDWGAHATLEADHLRVRTFAIQNGRAIAEESTHYSLASLRAWAGY